MPILLLGGSATQAASRPVPRIVAGGARLHPRALRRIQLADNRIATPKAPVATTTAPPASTPPATTSVTAAPPVTVAPVAVAAPTTTTTQAPANHLTGIATWYQWHAGQCASPTLPFGTVVEVTNSSTGARVTCEVTDREASNPGRVIDLDRSVFTAIAPLTAGAVTVTIAW